MNTEEYNEVVDLINGMKKDFEKSLDGEGDIGDACQSKVVGILEKLVINLRNDIIDVGDGIEDEKDAYYYYQATLVLNQGNVAMPGSNKSNVAKPIAGVVESDSSGYFNPNIILKRLKIPKERAKLIIQTFNRIDKRQSQILRKALGNANK